MNCAHFRGTDHIVVAFINKVFIGSNLCHQLHEVRVPRDWVKVNELHWVNWIIPLTHLSSLLPHKMRKPGQTLAGRSCSTLGLYKGLIIVQHLIPQGPVLHSFGQKAEVLVVITSANMQNMVTTACFHPARFHNLIYWQNDPNLVPQCHGGLFQEFRIPTDPRGSQIPRWKLIPLGLRREASYNISSPSFRSTCPQLCPTWWSLVSVGMLRIAQELLAKFWTNPLTFTVAMFFSPIFGAAPSAAPRASARRFWGPLGFASDSHRTENQREKRCFSTESFIAAQRKDRFKLKIVSGQSSSVNFCQRSTWPFLASNDGPNGIWWAAICPTRSCGTTGSLWIRCFACLGQTGACPRQPQVCLLEVDGISTMQSEQI